MELIFIPHVPIYAALLPKIYRTDRRSLAEMLSSAALLPNEVVCRANHPHKHCPDIHILIRLWAQTIRVPRQYHPLINPRCCLSSSSGGGGMAGQCIDIIFLVHQSRSLCVSSINNVHYPLLFINNKKDTHPQVKWQARGRHCRRRLALRLRWKVSYLAVLVTCLPPFRKWLIIIFRHNILIPLRVVGILYYYGSSTPIGSSEINWWLGLFKMIK